jgi:hypothetical protein
MRSAEDKIGEAMLRRTRTAQLACIVTGICTHLFLSGMVPTTGDIGHQYRSCWEDTFSVATTVGFISLILNKRWSDKIIELDESCRVYSLNREDLIDNLRVDILKSARALLLTNYFIIWVGLGVWGGCLFDGVLYGI